MWKKKSLWLHVLCVLQRNEGKTVMGASREHNISQDNMENFKAFIHFLILVCFTFIYLTFYCLASLWELCPNKKLHFPEHVCTMKDGLSSIDMVSHCQLLSNRQS